jgi:hypothetical protein
MLTDIITPEIYNDKFYHSLRQILDTYEINNILEIGASSGQGSTQCFLQYKENECKLFSIEISRERFNILKLNQTPNFFPYLGSSVNPSEYLTESEIADFHSRTKTNLNQYSLDTVLSWKEEELNYIKNNNTETGVIDKIKTENNIINFDLVLIDGSPFTGEAELKYVFGSKIIALDDINDIKCYDIYYLILNSGYYELVMEDWNIRNGFAIFKLK